MPPYTSTALLLAHAKSNDVQLGNLAPAAWQALGHGKGCPAPVWTGPGAVC